MPRSLPHGFSSMPLVRSYAYWRKGKLYRVEVRGVRGFMLQATFDLDTMAVTGLHPAPLHTPNPGDKHT